MLRARLLSLPLLLLLSGCWSGNDDDPARDARDPVAAAALDDPLLTDPDLTSQNRGNAALDGGIPDGAVPAFKRSSEEVAAAKADAERLLRGPIAAAPDPGGSTGTARLADVVTIGGLAKASGLGGACSGRIEYGFVWAARLPAALPVYPRGHALAAGGSDQEGCKLRVVRFVTPVEVSDVASFYYASARAAKLPAELSHEGDDTVVAGKGYAAFARKRPDGLTEVDLVTSGL